VIADSVRYKALAIAALGLLSCVPSAAWAQEGLLPGQAWIQVRYPSSPQPQERDDLIIRGAAQQEAKLLPFGSKASLRAKGRLTFVRDSERLPYNNKTIAALGLEVQASPVSFATIMAGVRQEWEHRYVSGNTSSGMVSYVGWTLWKELPLHRRAGRSRTFVVSSWAEGRYPSAPDPEERENAIVEGAVEVATPVASFHNGATLSAVLSGDFKVDTAGLDWNNQLSPATGLRITLPLGSKIRSEVGLKYVADYRFYSERFRHGPTLWVGAAASW